jgi:hypothetical protein
VVTSPQPPRPLSLTRTRTTWFAARTTPVEARGRAAARGAAAIVVAEDVQAAAGVVDRQAVSTVVPHVLTASVPPLMPPLNEYQTSFEDVPPGSQLAVPSFVAVESLVVCEPLPVKGMALAQLSFGRRRDHGSGIRDRELEPLDAERSVAGPDSIGGRFRCRPGSPGPGHPWSSTRRPGCPGSPSGDPSGSPRPAADESSRRCRSVPTPGSRCPARTCG